MNQILQMNIQVIGYPVCMNRSTKAVLLSALVFPGAGHWYLAKRWQSLVLMLATAAALVVLMSSAWTQANLIAEKVLNGEVQPEIGALMTVMAEQRGANESTDITIATVSLGIVWVLGVIGCWISGKSSPSER